MVPAAHIVRKINTTGLRDHTVSRQKCTSSESMLFYWNSEEWSIFKEKDKKTGGINIIFISVYPGSMRVKREFRRYEKVSYVDGFYGL